ncbi:hypothetical protein OROGR_004584 [Orobanche gracilis]
MEQSGSSNNSKNDICWNYVRMLKPPQTNDLVCNFCEKVTRGGIYRAKQHLAGGHRNVKACPRCPAHVREEIRDFMSKKVSTKNSIPDFEDVDTYGDDEDLDESETVGGSRFSKGGSSNTRSITTAKKPRVKGPMDVYFAQNPTKVVEARKKDKARQSTINEACKKELRKRACRDIARWMYDAAIAFNAVNHPSFDVMVESIGQYGCGMKPPTYHEVRVPLLRKEVNEVNEMKKSYEDECVKYGCSLMCDGWTDRKSRTLINFLSNSPKGTFFIESVDASEYSKMGERMCELIDSYIVRVGVENVVQVVTDSASSNVDAGRMLMAKRPHLYWTPCAAHCIDLILEDIGKLSTFKKTLKRAMSLNAYIYVRPGVVYLLREFTGHKELVRPGVTRFATAFLTLQRIHKQKNNLRKMFTSGEWIGSKWAKEAGGKEVTSIILMPTFWTSIVYILKIFGPLVRVLRLVDGEKKPAMGYIYEAMDRCKEAIMASFNHNEEKYLDIFKIIDNRWDCQLHQPLHAAGYYLNPEYFYSGSDFTQDEEVMKGFYASLQRLVTSHEEQDKITNQMSLYQNAEGLFGIEMAIRQRKTKAPAECTFEHIHSKKRNRLAQKRLNDLVYVKYNRALKRRYEARDRIDPITLRDIDDNNEWLIGALDEENQGEEDDLVFEDDSLTWDAVARASGVGEEAYNTRSVKGKGKSVVVSTSFTKSAAKQVEKGKNSYKGAPRIYRRRHDG